MNVQHTIQIADPGAAYRAHQAEINAAIHRVLSSGRYIMGGEVAAFENEFASYCGVPHAIGVGSGTDALHLALRTCDIGPGDLVVTVSNTAVATVAAIELAGAIPFLVDIDAATFTMDVASLEQAITTNQGRIRAVVPVHLYGHPADMKSIMRIANQHDIIVIEDCAQAHGAMRDGQMVGSWGHMAAYSFYPTKNLGALGDAGAVTTSDPQLARKARLLQQYGWEQRYISKIPGMNTRLDEIQAAVLRVKLPHLDQENARRLEIASIYDDQLCALPWVILPDHKQCDRHVFHQYTIRSSKRDQLREHLHQKKIGAATLYPEPIHLQEAYKGRIGICEAGLTITESAVVEILSLPIHFGLGDSDASYVADQVLSLRSRACPEENALRYSDEQ